MKALTAVLTILAALFGALAVPAAPAADAAKPAPAPGAREPGQSVFAGTAIGHVLEANDNEVPRNGEEMMATLAKLGDFAQLPVAFSAVDLRSGLARPRVVITVRPSAAEVPPKVLPGTKRLESTLLDQLRVLPEFALPPVAQTPLPRGELTRPNLEGRLFIAANMEPANGTLKVKTFEFISWNSRRQRFDFGFIECDEQEPQIRIVDGVKCFSCHKNKGPILGQGPWSNTTHNDMVRAAAAQALKVDVRRFGHDSALGQPRRLDAGFDRGLVRLPPPSFDGVSVFVPQGPAVDAGVRLGADLARDRDVYRHMMRSADGRRAAGLLFAAIAAPGDLKQNSDALKARLNVEFANSYALFADRFVNAHKASANVLADFSPAGSQGALKNVVTQSGGGWGGGSTLSSELRIVWSGSPNTVEGYDARRAAGEHGLPSHRRPSNPRAFVTTEVKLPTTPAAAVNAVALARLVGVTEADRAFLAAQLAEAARLIGKKATPATVARDVFARPEFAEVLAAGGVPDREDFKDRFVAALNALLKARGAAELKLARADYASGPNVAPVPGQEVAEPAVVPTTACLRCHDVRGAGKPAFSPIPLLAFDPFDKDAREAWLKGTAVKDRAPVLARLLKRVAEDRDMPPEDAPEHDHFRAKNPAAFDAVKGWLEAELQKAK